MPNDACLFCRMASGEIDVPKLYDDDLVFAIRDINLRAPVHLLIIPKSHIDDARVVGDRQSATLGRMFAVSSALAEGEGLRERGYRIAFNVGEDAGMTVSHLHMHVLGGRRLGAEG
ncbi:MAG: HIT domain-containing protein [Dehalococcoidia bacterium]